MSLDVTNSGKSLQTFSVGNQRAVDSQGREFAPTGPPMSMVIGQTTGMVDLNPGFSAKAKLMFDVAPGAQITAVQLHDSAFSGGVRVEVP